MSAESDSPTETLIATWMTEKTTLSATPLAALRSSIAVEPFSSDVIQSALETPEMNEPPAERPPGTCTLIFHNLLCQWLWFPRDAGG